MKTTSTEFAFKHFYVSHHKSPMKVTTDSLLLGAWAPITPVPLQILDIGTGCGILALMLAQRLADHPIKIDAIDIDAEAIAECQENCQNSLFSSITAFCADIKQFTLNTSSRYALIISNPPYFQQAVNCRSNQRQNARYTTHLNYLQLLNCAQTLLAHNGRFCLVLPFSQAETFKQLAMTQGWYIESNTWVKHQQNYKPYLQLLSLVLHDVNHHYSEIVLRHTGQQYTTQFTQLLQDFYLRF